MMDKKKMIQIFSIKQAFVDYMKSHPEEWKFDRRFGRYMYVRK